jgi:hypothetical protein
MMLQSADELKAQFKHLQGRYFWTLNAEVEVTKSVPISNLVEIQI